MDSQTRLYEARKRLEELTADSQAPSQQVHAALEEFGAASEARGKELDAEKRERARSGQTVFCCYLDVDGFRQRVLEDAPALFGLSMDDRR